MGPAGRYCMVGAPLGLAAWILGVALGAAPAAPSYHGIERTIAQVREDWKQAGARPQPNAPGWEAFFDAVSRDLHAYATAETEDARLRPLGRLYQMSVALQGVSWAPAVELRAGLREWLGPRVRLAWAGRRLKEAIAGLPPVDASAARENRRRWLGFVDDDLGGALRAYEGAETVAGRQDALKRIYGALTTLDDGYRTSGWAPSWVLQEALNDLYNRPNLNAAADVATVAPALSADVIQTGPIVFKGNTSYVTAGARTGFGLLPSDDGIAFYNSQLMSSVTPVNGFHEQLAADPKGRRAARMYYFNATTYVSGEQTVVALLRTTGLVLDPSASQNIAAAINSLPIQGAHARRFIAGLVGYGQRRINDEVYRNAIGRIREGVVENSRELTAIKTSEAVAEKNAQLGQYLVGDDTLVYRNLEITDLSLRSRPEHALIGGTLQWRGADEQVGADRPRPSRFAEVPAGVAADVHLPSILTNLTRGALQSDQVRDVKNLMIVTRKLPEGAPPSAGVLTTRNVDFPTFLKAVEAAQAAKDPKVAAIRVTRPDRVPEFTADARGYLVALVHDFTIEVPAPERVSGIGLFGQRPKVYRIAAQEAEFVVSFQIEPQRGELPIRLAGRVEEVDFGSDVTVTPLTADEEGGAPLNRLATAAVLAGVRTKIQGQPIDVPLSAVRLPNFVLGSVSPLDPSGWLRVVLSR